MLNNILISLILSILLGSIIGSQREIRIQKKNLKDFAGFRTFTLVSLLGYLFGFISTEILKNYYFLFIGLIGIIFFAIIAYKTVLKINPNNISSITEVLFVIVFLIGFLLSQNYFQLSIFITIIIVTLLFLGNKLHQFTKKIKEEEIFASLKFAIISLIILPLLPNKDYTLLEIPYISNFFNSQTLISHQLLSELNVFNFFNIWLMVVFISGIAYIGYILMKTIGAEKGIQITGFLGGLISSTAVTSSFSIESKKYNYISIPLAIGTIIACSTMFFRIILEVLVLNPNLLLGITLSLGGLGMIGFMYSYYLFKKSKLNHVKEVNFESPFTIGPAIKFSFFFLFILFLSKLFSILFGNSGIYLLSFISGFSDVDAITFSLSNLSKTGAISNISAQIGIVIAALSNTVIKGGIAYYFGSKKFSKQIIIIFSVMIIFGLIFGYIIF